MREPGVPAAGPFRVGQIWRRVDDPDRLFVVFKVVPDIPPIAALHAQAVPIDQVHLFDVWTIATTERDLAQWELAEWVRPGVDAECRVCRLAEPRLALRRLASTETFTVALDLNHPTKVKTETVIDELQARLEYAADAVAALGRARRES